MNDNDPHNLQRFLDGQARDYQQALSELQAGLKMSHWIWYVFPQVAGLGYSPTARRYAIQSRKEALEYLNHEILGARLRKCCEALLQHKGKRINDIMGYPDDLKLRSSMTLFALLSEEGSIFHAVLDAFYSGQMDERTISFMQ